MSDSRTLIWRYYLFQTTNSAGFYLPVAIYFLVDNGYGTDFVLFSYAVFSLASVAVEIPSGYVGDLVGRRGSLAIGAALRAVSIAAYPFAVAWPSAILGLHVTWATGRAFRSGTQDAWLYEVLAARFDESEFARIEGRGSSALLVTSAAAAVAGGLLYTVDPAYPFLANAALALVGLPILATFPTVGTLGDETGDGDDRADADDGPDPGREVFTVREAVQVLALQARRPSVRWLVAYAALFMALFSVTRSLEQPALDAVGVPVAGLGVLYAAFKLVSAGTAATAGWIQARLGVRRVFALLVPAYVLGYAAIAVAPLAVVPVLFFNRSRRLVTRPVRNQYLNDRLHDVGRATVLSGASMALSLAAAGAKFAVTPLAARLGPVGVLPYVGVGLALLAGGLWVTTTPVRAHGGCDGPPGTCTDQPALAD
jgi:MFS family permease